MASISIAFLLGAVMLCAFPAAESCWDSSQTDAANLDNWRNTLFNGLSQMNKRTATGPWTKIITFGEKSYITLIGEGATNGLMAVGKVDGQCNSTVVVLGHDRHVKKMAINEKAGDLKIFHTNIKTFIKNGETGTFDICHPKTSSEISSCLANSNNRILLYESGAFATEQDNADVLAWVKQGNSLILGFGINQFNKATAESLNHLPFYSTVLAAGIAIHPNKAKVTTAKNLDTSLGRVSSQELINLNYRLEANAADFSTFTIGPNLTDILNFQINNARFFTKTISAAVIGLWKDFAIANEANMNFGFTASASVSPDSNYVTTTTRDQNMFKLYYGLAKAGLWKNIGPNAENYPGSVANATLETVSFTLSSKDVDHWHATGYYLNPGQDMTVTITNTDDDWKSFRLLLGIDRENLKDKVKISRFPLIKFEDDFVDKQFTVNWMYGGLVSIKAKAGTGKTLSITLSGVSKVPYLNTTDASSLSAWPTSCNNIAPVVDINGEYSRVTIRKSGGVCTMTGTQIKAVMDEYDSAIKLNHELKYGNGNRTKLRSEWFTEVLQTVLGTMHHGYPIVGKLVKGDITNTAFYLSGQYDKFWGTFHELGHNVDEGWWTNSLIIEVTANIFAFFQWERLAGKTWADKYTATVTGTKFANWMAVHEFTASQYKNDVRSLAYTQVIRDFGHNCLHGVLKSYEDDYNNNKAALPTTTNQEYSEFIRRYSLNVGYDLSVFFCDFWKWPCTTLDHSAISHLDPFLPDDITTQHSSAASVTADIVANNANLVRVPDPVNNPHYACPTFNSQ